jgi:hypothetical protein
MFELSDHTNLRNKTSSRGNLVIRGSLINTQYWNISNGSTCIGLNEQQRRQGIKGTRRIARRTHIIE